MCTHISRAMGMSTMYAQCLRPTSTIAGRRYYMLMLWTGAGHGELAVGSLTDPRDVVNSWFSDRNGFASD